MLQEVLIVVGSGCGGDNETWGNFQILGPYFCIWRCQNKVQGRRCWGNVEDVSLDRFYRLGMARFYLYVVLQNGFP
jgi:hypothetical protein